MILLLLVLGVYLLPLFVGKSNPGKTFMKFLFLGGVLFVSGAIFITTVDSPAGEVGGLIALFILIVGYTRAFFW